MDLLIDEQVQDIDLSWIIFKNLV